MANINAVDEGAWVLVLGAQMIAGITKEYMQEAVEYFNYTQILN